MKRAILLLLIISVLIISCSDGYAEEATPTPKPVDTSTYHTGYPSGADKCWYMDRNGDPQRMSGGVCD